jgi:hypothetical protein
MLSQSQVEDVVGVRREIVVLLALQLEALDSPQGLTEAKLMECYQRQTRVQEWRDQLQAISDLKEAQLGFQFNPSVAASVENAAEVSVR